LTDIAIGGILLACGIVAKLMSMP